MSLKQPIVKTIYSSNIAKSLLDLYKIGWCTTTSRFPVGTNVFERNWDALILLDTCRIDAIEEVAPEYDFIERVDSIVSVGSTSGEWMANTFTKDHREKIRETVYVSANAFSKHLLVDRNYPPPQIEIKQADWKTVEADEFLYLDQAWQYQEGHPEGHTLPEETTKRAIAAGRKFDFSQFIVHYSPPHAPYTANALDGGKLEEYEKNPFESLRNGTSFSKVWNAYLDHLRLVLDWVEVLIKNLDAEKVVISADHGEAFGEFGLYGHGTGYIHPFVKKVPWVETTATDHGEITPSIEIDDPQKTINDDSEEQLRNLGYL